MKSIRKKIVAVLCIVVLMMGILVVLINFYINSKSNSYIFQEMNDIPETKVVLILGAKVYQQGIMSGILQDRVDTAIDLYQNNRVEKILVSGDHGKENYDEVNSVKNYLIEKGASKSDIFLDYAGFDTYDSLYRAKKIFQVQSVVISTQNFHLSRAVYIGREIGIETYGISADKHSYINIKYNEFREIFSKVKAFLDVNFDAKPKFLGEKININGDGRKSWDEKVDVDVFDKNDVYNNKSNANKEVTEENIVEDNLEEKADKNINKVETIEEKNVLLDVPFFSQAPFSNWSDARKQDGCEEVSAIMAMAWVRGEGLTSQIVDDKINEISAFEEGEIGTFHDTNAKDTMEIIFKKYFKYNQVEVKYNIDKEDIKKELFKGNLVIIPTDGQLLYNPNYTPPGPTTHNLVVIGYNMITKEFITNDPGTRNGEKYRYSEDILEDALLDYPTGFHEKIKEIETAMIIIKNKFEKN